MVDLDILDSQVQGDLVCCEVLTEYRQQETGSWLSELVQRSVSTASEESALMSQRRFRHPANRRSYEQRSTGERMADRLSASFGSWAFILAQSVIVLLWITLNLVAWMWRWDPYPFILLNLVFSTQAAYAAPLLLLSQNRQAERDRIQAEHDFRVNQLALQYLFAWHRDAHGADCGCVRQLGPEVDAVLTELADGLVDDAPPVVPSGTAQSPPSTSR